MPTPLAQTNHAARREPACRGGWHELAVANPTFLLERLGSECTDVQGLRELTVNGLDAIAALGGRAGGRVVWDLDRERLEASGGRVRKLSVIDTGTGMTAEQLRYYINNLAASGREQSGTGNFGVGAKVAAGSHNPHGLEYRSWHQGEGSLVCFKRHPDGRWGLAPQHWPDGRSDFWRPLGEEDKPWLLRGQGHGTKVVLLGQHERHDTTQAPGSVTDSRRHWITRYLNGRFVQLPEQVEVLVRDLCASREPGQLLQVHGERHHLEQHAVAAGAVELSDAIARWWVLDDDHRGRRRQSGVWASTGHAAAVLGDELYDPLPQTHGGYGRLQDFGIRFGYERVVLHLQPLVQAGHVEANTARTMLLLDHQPLPWHRWGEEFAARMPAEILKLQERVASADGVPRREAIRGRVTPLMALYRLSPYRPVQMGRRRSAQPQTAVADCTPGSALTVARAPEPRQQPGADAAPRSDNREPICQQATGTAAADPPDDQASAESNLGLPDVAWISARDGSRPASDLEDQAARYHPTHIASSDRLFATPRRASHEGILPSLCSHCRSPLASAFACTRGGPSVCPSRLWSTACSRCRGRGGLSAELSSRSPQREGENPRVSRAFLYGASRARTGDLLHAMQALSQLSYSPFESEVPFQA